MGSRSEVRYRFRSLIARGLSRIRVQAYLRRGRRPWTLGYGDYRAALLEKALRDEGLMRDFRDGGPVPRGYGARLDERVVEYAWALSRLSEEPARLLDAGSTLNFEEILDLPVVKRKTVHIVTLAPEPRCYWWKGVSYLFADLRALPVRDDHYDEIVCLSTLEHVGLDNSQYTWTPSPAQGGDFVAAVSELRRVLRPGGVLLATVPYGRRMDFSWQRQFDRAMVEQLREAFRPAWSRTAYYRYSETGWVLSDSEEASTAEYFDVRTAPGFDADYAAAARAVACLELRK